MIEKSVSILPRCMIEKTKLSKVATRSNLNTLVNYTSKFQAKILIDWKTFPKSISWLDMIFLNKNLEKNIENIIIENYEELNESDHLTMTFLH